MNVGLSNTAEATDFAGNKIFAMGDLNNDKLNDMVTVSDDQRTFQPWFYDSVR